MKNLAPLAAVLFTLLSLTAYGKQERVYTVKEFMSDRPLMESTVKKCADNPGQLSKTPNCVNASNANSRLYMCREFGRTDEQCIDRHFGNK